MNPISSLLSSPHLRPFETIFSGSVCRSSPREMNQPLRAVGVISRALRRRVRLEGHRAAAGCLPRLGTRSDRPALKHELPAPLSGDRAVSHRSWGRLLRGVLLGPETRNRRQESLCRGKGTRSREQGNSETGSANRAQYFSRNAMDTTLRAGPKALEFFVYQRKFLIMIGPYLYFVLV